MTPVGYDGHGAPLYPHQLPPPQETTTVTDADHRDALALGLLMLAAGLTVLVAPAYLVLTPAHVLAFDVVPRPVTGLVHLLAAGLLLVGGQQGHRPTVWGYVAYVALRVWGVTRTRRARPLPRRADAPVTAHTAAQHPARPPPAL